MKPRGELSPIAFRRAPVLWALAAAALATGVGGGLATAAQSQDQETEKRFDGEYGLFARLIGDQLVVRWITAEEGIGWFVARADGPDGEVLVETETPPGVSHLARVPVEGVRTVDLEYGSAEDEEDRHHTRIWVESERITDPRYEDVDSIFVLGDIHGEFDRLILILYNAGLVDAEFRWVGGRSHLVLLGDLFDRGPDVTRLLWFLYGLERQAEEAGGRLHVVLGNHEFMVMTDDDRYVHGKEFLIAMRHDLKYYAELFDPRTSILGQWLISKPALIKIDEVLLAHGGVSEEYLEYSIEEFQDTLVSYVEQELLARDPAHTANSARPGSQDNESVNRIYDFFFGEESVFWFRGFVQTRTLGWLVNRVLERHDSEIHVIAHTAVGTIEELYDGRLIAVDMAEPATEMLLLARTEGGRARYRYRLFGPPEPLTETAAGRD